MRFLRFALTSHYLLPRSVLSRRGVVMPLSFIQDVASVCEPGCLKHRYIVFAVSNVQNSPVTKYSRPELRDRGPMAVMGNTRLKMRPDMFAV